LCFIARIDRAWVLVVAKAFTRDAARTRYKFRETADVDVASIDGTQVSIIAVFCGTCAAYAAGADVIFCARVVVVARTFNRNMNTAVIATDILRAGRVVITDQ